MAKKILFIILIILLYTQFLAAQSPYIHHGSIGDKETKISNYKQNFKFLPKTQWIDKRFIFLPKRKSFRNLKYREFRIGDHQNNQPTYSEYVGRIAKVTSTNNGKITFKMEGSNKLLTVRSYSENDIIRGIALVADIDNARKIWVGKKLWFLNSLINRYDEETDTLDYIKNVKNSIVEVIDIVAGWDSRKPIRFIVRTLSGDEGFVDINLSGTNAIKNYYTFESTFSIKNPKK